MFVLQFGSAPVLEEMVEITVQNSELPSLDVLLNKYMLTTVTEMRQKTSNTYTTM